MGRKHEEINEKTGIRLKSLLKENGKSQIWLAEQLGYVPQHINLWCTSKRHLPEEQARKIAGLFPGTRYEWLMGFDDFKTKSEPFKALMAGVRSMAGLLTKGTLSFATISGYKITEQSHADTENSECDTDGYKIEKGGKSAFLSTQDFYDLETEFCEYIDLRLNHIIEKQASTEYEDIELREYEEWLAVLSPKTQGKEET